MVDMPLNQITNMQVNIHFMGSIFIVNLIFIHPKGDDY